jgi:hypothetical protein
VNIIEENSAFEAWLHKQCKVYEPDLEHKHRRMRRDTFTFLRATYFRWANGIEAICPDLAACPAVLSVGDIHLENFGTWRDEEGRLIWGVNDFDEAAIIPYAYDLVRLAASARLARDAKNAKHGELAPYLELSNRETAEALLNGYRLGLKKPRPTILDEKETWLRPYVVCTDEKRSKFWEELWNLEAEEAKKVNIAAMQGLMERLPKGASIVHFARRPKQGGGSLGRPRFVAIAKWHGGYIAREAKALIPSSWYWAHGEADAPILFEKLSKGPHRAPDPWLHVTDSSPQVKDRFVIRRLAADARKVNLAQNTDTDAPKIDGEQAKKLLHAMGFDIGSVHAESEEKTHVILTHLDQREKDWLYVAAKSAANWVGADYADWCSV